MSDSYSKRKWAGEPHTDKRRSKAPDVEHLPPHKKPKVWGLALEWTETTTRRMTRQFPSKAARDEARIRIERHFRERVAVEKNQGRRRWWSGFYNTPLANFDEAESKAIKAGPEYFETYEDAPAHPTGESREP